MVKSLGFGSNFRHYSVILTLGLSTCCPLASNVNLVTHYAKGTFFSFYFIIRTAYKITIYVCSLTVLYTIAYALYLVLEEGSPYRLI